MAATAAAVAGEVLPPQWRREVVEDGAFQIGQAIAAVWGRQIRTLLHPL